MIIRKTLSTKQKRIYRGKFDAHKKAVLMQVETWWFLFIPVFKRERVVE